MIRLLLFASALGSALLGEIASAQELATFHVEIIGDGITVEIDFQQSAHSPMSPTNPISPTNVMEATSDSIFAPSWDENDAHSVGAAFTYQNSL